MATVSHSLDNPIAQFSPYQLRIARYQVKWQLRFRRVKLGYEIQQAFADAYALIVGQHYEAANTVIMRPHVHVSDSDECNRLKLVHGDVAADACAKFTV